MSEQENYTALAPIYDDVMYDVDYEVWADFIDAVLLNHHPDPRTILELACGTGSFALFLDELEQYFILATDKSEAMLEIARTKNREQDRKVRFQQADIRDLSFDETFDAVVMLFDSLNYLHSHSEIEAMFDQVYSVLDPEGLFVFDFTTPQNSMEAIHTLNNEHRELESGYRYSRKSMYDRKKRIHINDFSIYELNSADGGVIDSYREIHKQKIYTLEEIRELVRNSPFELVAQYSGFELVEADEESLRITMVVQKV